MLIEQIRYLSLRIFIKPVEKGRKRWIQIKCYPNSHNITLIIITFLTFIFSSLSLFLLPPILPLFISFLITSLLTFFPLLCHLSYPSLPASLVHCFSVLHLQLYRLVIFYIRVATSRSPDRPGVPCWAKRSNANPISRGPMVPIKSQ